MSIIIDDMKMPKSCITCPFEHNGDCYGGKLKWIMDIEGFDYYRHPCCPLIEAEPIKHGRWLRTDAYPHRIYCSECYATFIRNDEFLKLNDIPHNYCPNCGARMNLEEDGENDNR